MVELKQTEINCQNELGNADGAIRDLLRENERLKAALRPFAMIGEALYASGDKVLIGASARFLKLEPLTGLDFVTASAALNLSATADEEQG